MDAKRSMFQITAPLRWNYPNRFEGFGSAAPAA